MAPPILQSVQGSIQDVVPLKTALVSVYDKSNIELLGNIFKKFNVRVMSTGGTAKKLRDLGCKVEDVGDYTQSPEILDGRVKSLHPRVHGGILAARGNRKHEEEMQKHGIVAIDLVVGNLYPFADAVKSGGDFNSCIENIDIGGPCMIRSSAKNSAGACSVTDPAQYESLLQELVTNNGGTTYQFRKTLAVAAFSLTATYDAAISRYFVEQATKESLKGSSPRASTQTGKSEAVPMVTDAVAKPAAGEPKSVTFDCTQILKYGCNPHQNPAFIGGVNGAAMPFKILNGTPGYVNLLDAINSWQLVFELQRATGLPASASFKHVSPAGAALGVPLTEEEAQVFEVVGKELTPAAWAYVRARNADPLCSFGDFAALSCEVDVATAKILKIEVSDGIIAPSYSPDALAILKEKKNGAFVILEANPNFETPKEEYRTIGGVGFVQRRNYALFREDRLQEIVTKNNYFPPAIINDLILNSITIKYTQSNSVGYSRGGMMVGVGAGQQSRVDCVKLAGRKVQTFLLRSHPKVMNLKFKRTVKRQQRVNARVRYIEGDFTDIEKKQWEQLFDMVPSPLTEQEKTTHLKKTNDVSVSSDAFFPFRDSIDYASKIGVKYVAQPGGSVADQDVIEACDEYGMAMAFTKLRLFHH